MRVFRQSEDALALLLCIVPMEMLQKNHQVQIMGDQHLWAHPPALVGSKTQRNNGPHKKIRFFNLDPTGEFFRKGNNRTTKAGPHKPPSVRVCVCVCWVGQGGGKGVRLFREPAMYCFNVFHYQRLRSFVCQALWLWGKYCYEMIYLTTLYLTVHTPSNWAQ